jgi:putative endonuclease
MYWVYIIYCQKPDRYYIGYSDDPDKRLIQHNEGMNRSTKFGFPNWIIVYREPFPTRIEALKREKAIKARKSKMYLRSLIKATSLP